jgi:uncharacterized repeat protein (TIGR04042 family)
MPELYFKIRWPDGTPEVCYSPSLIIKEFFSPGERYPLAEFLRRSRESLGIASRRVQEKYGVPCARAEAQLARLESVSQRYADDPSAHVLIDGFEE